ncbi:hypothetical protein GGI35DRAFT_489345 [Trichoderma velutinum]
MTPVAEEEQMMGQDSEEDAGDIRSFKYCHLARIYIYQIYLRRFLMTHTGRKAGLEEVKALEEGGRSEAILRMLATKSSVFHEADIDASGFWKNIGNSPSGGSCCKYLVELFDGSGYGDQSGGHLEELGDLAQESTEWLGNLPTRHVPDGSNRWDTSLEDILAPHIIDLLVEKAQYHYGLKRMAPEELEKPPPKVIRGPDAPLSPSPVPSELFIGDQSPVPMPDYAEYGYLIHVWSAAPEGVHWAWKARREEAKGLEGGNRSEAALRDLVTKASEAEKDDWRMIRQHIENIFETGYELSDEDIDTLLPLAFGRILGIGPPEGLVTRIWADYLRRLAMKVNMEAASCIQGILYDLRSPSFANDVIWSKISKGFTILFGPEHRLDGWGNGWSLLMRTFIRRTIKD